MNYDNVLDMVKSPVKISFEPTINCNLRCPMCDRTKKDGYRSYRDDQLPYETVKAFMHEAGKLRIRHFLFIGGGEPLMDPHIIEYMEILKSYGVYVHLWTNGTLIDENNAGLLTKYCDMITVSLDSPDPVINDMSRGTEGATQKAVNGIRLLRKNSDSLFLRIHSVISPINLDHLREIADFAAKNGVTEIGGGLIAPFDFIPDNMRFSKNQIGMINNRLEDLSEYAKTKGVALAGCYANISSKIIGNLTHIHNMYGTPGDTSSKHVTCMGLWSQATVRPNGDVCICCFTYEPVLGNLRNSTFDEIWNSKKAQELRTLVRRGEYLAQPCIGCDTGHPVFTKDLEMTGSLESLHEMTVNAR